MPARNKIKLLFFVFFVCFVVHSLDFSVIDMTTHQQTSALSRELIVPAIADALRKLSPRAQFRNPVMFVVFVCSVLTTGLWFQALAGHGEAPAGFIFWISIWLWFTLLFANFARQSPKAAARRRRRHCVARAAM